jgi:hypothetical protein
MKKLNLFALFVVVVLAGAGCVKPVSLEKEPEASRFAWTRVTSGFVWGEMQKSMNAEYDWSVTDVEIERAHSSDHALLVVLSPFAQWDQQSCHKQLTQKVISVCYVEGYEKWVKAVVERYHDKVTHWEIANNPLDQTGPFAYAELFTLAYNQIKLVDSTATVLIGGVPTDWSQGYWREVFKLTRNLPTVLTFHSTEPSNDFSAGDFQNAKH